MKQRYQVVALVIILAMSILTVSNVSYASISSLNDAKKNVENDIKEKQKEIEEMNEAAEGLTDQVISLEKKIRTSEGNLSKLNSEITAAEAQQTKLQKELEIAESKVKDQNTNLNSRIRNMYKNGSIGFVDVLLDSGSFSEFLTNFDMVQKIFAGDRNVLEELKEIYNEIDQKKAKVISLQEELKEAKAVAEQEKQNLQTDKNTLLAKKEAIESNSEEAAKMLDKLEAQADSITDQIREQERIIEEQRRKEAEAKAKENGSTVEEEIAASPAVAPAGGKLAWPAPSYARISSYFGPRWGRQHTGIDLASKSGNPIVAAEVGTVTYAGWNGGYGNCVIIYHGNNMSTLYGHASKIHVSKGQTVARGQRIADIGSTGYSTGPHLHFEVRINGNRVNPLPYIQ